MLDIALQRVNTLQNLKGIKVTIVKADATSELINKFKEESFDTIIDSFSLCVMGNDGAKQCIQQISKIVKKQKDHGQIFLLENSRSSNSLLGAYQDITAEAAATTGGKGCIYNQDVGNIIRQSGVLRIEQEILYSAGIFRLFKCTRM